MSSEQKKIASGIALLLFLVFCGAIVAVCLKAAEEYKIDNGYEEISNSSQVTARILKKFPADNLKSVPSEELNQLYDFPEGMIKDFSLYTSSADAPLVEVGCFRLSASADSRAFDSVVSKRMNASALPSGAGTGSNNLTKQYIVTHYAGYALVAVHPQSSEVASYFPEIFKLTG